MGTGMSQILPGLAIGSLKDSQDRSQLRNLNITHIVSIHEDAKENPAFKVNLFYSFWKD
jgi:atypical dual specificity phosphatase